MRYLYLCAIIASFGGLLSGFDTGVISGALLYINKSFDINSTMLGLIVSSVSIGAVIGAFINAFFVDKIGRRKTFLLCAFLFIIGSICCYFAQNVIELILSRGLIGVAVGIVSFVAPLYLSEISTKEKRGMIVSFHQLAITFGILFSYIINFYFANFENNWRIMLSFGIFPALILFFGMLIQKDTPRWLVMKDRIEEAKEILLKLDDRQNINEIINDIKHVAHAKFEINKKLLKPFIIGIGMMFIQIATGINAIIYYTPTIFKMIGFSSNQDALLCTIFIGLINFLMTFVAIAFVDKIGRKPLLYIGLSGMLISLLSLSFVFIFNIKILAILSIALYIVSFSMSLGPVALLLISEVFPLKYRASAMSFSIVSNFVFNFIVTLLFPISIAKIGGCYTFLIFALIVIFAIFFVYFVVPETKGISLEELEEKLI